MSGPLGSSQWMYSASSDFFTTTLDQSLRFEEADTPSLSRTQTSGTTTTWTFSAWVKRSRLDSVLQSGSTAGQDPIFCVGDSNTDDMLIYFHQHTTADRLDIIIRDSSTIRARLTTTRQFRDVAAWYHIQVTCDFTNATQGDRLRLYVNGVRETAFDTETYPSDTSQITVVNNSSYTARIGQLRTSASYFAGYMAEVHLVDGSALEPTSFGEFSNGVWIPISYSGSHGTAGWYLPFSQDASSGASTFFNEADNGYVAWTDPGTEYVIGSSDDYTLELFFNPTSTEMSGNSYIAGYYKRTSPTGYFALQTNLSTRNFYLYHGDGQAYTFGTYSVGDVVAGQWHHLVINRVSGNLRCFLDGTQVGSTEASNTKDHDIPEFRVNKAHATSNTTFDGYVSNVRLVIGSAVYADGSSITVPTSTLTAVTNTKILACTTTTITADASSNNVTGTTGGSGFFASDTSPFANFNFYDDTSGNTNNFSANNLFDSDVMTGESPTNNFATFNNLVHFSATTDPVFSEGNLKTRPESDGISYKYTGVGSTINVSSGKWYAEFKPTATTGSTNGYLIGIIEQGLDRWTSNSAGSTWDGGYIYAGSGTIQGNGNVKTTSWGDTFTTDDVIGVALDMDDGKLWFSKNGVFQASGDPAAGTNAAFTTLKTYNDTYAFSVGCGQTSSQYHQYEGNFGQNPSFNGTFTGGDVGTQTDGNGIGLFKYAPPSGFLALCTSNLAEPTIGPNSTTQAEDNFDIVLYTGNGVNNGDAQEINGLSFTPDFTWIKARNQARWNELHDSVRGAGKRVFSNENNDESDFQTLTSFDNDGFTVALGTSGQNGTNENGTTYVGWSWKAGGAASSIAVDEYSTGVPSIASSVSANQDAGFSIVSYQGNLTSGATVGHGLSETPELIIVKNRDSAQNWNVWNKNLTSEYVLYLNLTSGQNNSPASFGTHTNQVFGVDNSVESNGSTNAMIAYCFHSVEGYQKIGTYLSNNIEDGTFVFLGFRPKLVIIKRDGSFDWQVLDSERSPFNPADKRLEPNEGVIEATSSSTSDFFADFLSNGFKLRGNGSSANGGSSALYFYLAIGETSFKYSNAR